MRYKLHIHTIVHFHSHHYEKLMAVPVATITNKLRYKVIIETFEVHQQNEATILKSNARSLFLLIRLIKF